MFRNFPQRTPDEVYASLINGKVDGLVTIPLPSDTAVIERLADSYLPVVALADAMRNVIRYLIQ